MPGTELARAFVTITGNAGPLRATLAAVRRDLTGFAGAAAALLGGAALAGGALFFKMTSGAADLAESVSKVEYTFGQSAGKITAFVDQMAERFGSVKSEMLDATANIALIGKGAGYTQAAAADLSVAMVKLADDASSLYNVPLNVSLEKIRAGLVGEAEPLRQFGVLLTEDAVKLEAARLGISRMGTELTQAQKVQARVSLITKGLAVATGDHARTMESAKNQTREFWGRLRNLSDTIGTELLPLFTPLVAEANRFVKEFAQGWKTGEGAFGSFKEAVTGAVESVGFVFQNFGDIMELAQVNAEEMLGNVVAAFDALGGYLAGNWKDLMLDSLQSVLTGIKNFGHNVVQLMAMSQMGPKEFFKALADPAAAGFDMKNVFEGFVGQAAKLREEIKPVWVDMAKDRDEILGRIGAREAQRQKAKAGAGGAVAPPWAPPEEEPTKAKKAARGSERPSFQSAEEFYKSLQEGALGRNRPEEETAKNTALVVKKLDQVIQIWKAKPGDPGFAVGPA